MSVTGLAGVWDIEDVLGASRASNGVPMLQIGDVRTGAVTDNAVVAWNPSGFIGYPRAPTAGSDASQTILLKSAAGDQAFGFRDVKTAKLSGQMQMGETCVYAPGSQARIFLKNDGSITLYTTDDNTDGGKSVFLSVGPDGIRFGGPWGVVTLDAKALMAMHSSGSALHLAKDASLVGSTSSIRGAGNAYCTAGALNPAQGVAYSAVGPANVFSNTVIVSP